MHPRSDGPTPGFERFALGAGIQRGIAETGFSEPRPIQVQTIPAALQGHDVLGLAQTGTGKTAAFALPILERLSAGRKDCGPRALIVAPTRELAAQIHAEFERLGRYTTLRAVTIFGGVATSPQVRALRARPDIVIACPGRLLDLLEQRALTLSDVEVLVLDEADHMFDMGFLPDVRRILKALPRRRQNLLFSATMPREIRGLADQILVRPTVVELARSAPAETIEHGLYDVHPDAKTDLLRHLLEQPDFTSGIVFLRTKQRAKRLATQLSKLGHDAVALQGNMSQPQREKALAGFRAGRYDVLVATDIAARGIDVADVSHVVNYDVPNTPDAYTHRIGRTGRSEKSGKAFTFVTREDAEALRAIEKRIGAPIQRFLLPELASTGSGGLGRSKAEPAAGQRSRGGGGRGHRVASQRSMARSERAKHASRPIRAVARPAERRPEPLRPAEPVVPFGAIGPTSKHEPAVAQPPRAEATRRRRRRRAARA